MTSKRQNQSHQTSVSVSPFLHETHLFILTEAQQAPLHSVHQVFPICLNMLRHSHLSHTYTDISLSDPDVQGLTIPFLMHTGPFSIHAHHYTGPSESQDDVKAPHIVWYVTAHQLPGYVTEKHSLIKFSHITNLIRLKKNGWWHLRVQKGNELRPLGSKLCVWPSAQP